MSTMGDVEVLRAACCVAGLDGRITDGEMALLRRLAQRAGVGSVSLQAMIDRAKTDHNFYQEQFRLYATDPEATMTAVLGVAVCDGELSADERVVLQLFADRLKLSPERFDKLLAAAEKYLAQRRASGDASS